MGGCIPVFRNWFALLFIYLFALNAFFNHHASLLWLVENKGRWFPTQNHFSCTIHTSGIIAKTFVSVVTLMFLVMFNIMGMSSSRNLCSGVKGKRRDNLWGVVIDLLIRSSSELSFSGLAKQVNSYKRTSLKKGIWRLWKKCGKYQLFNSIDSLRAADRV